MGQTSQLRSLENLNRYEVILASNSPRRRELLGQLGIRFRVSVPTGVDESYPASLAAENVPEYLARVKAQAYLDQLWKPGELVIAADTVVICDGRVLGKPADEEEARAMLRMLSGKTHKVVSGVAVSNRETTVSFSAMTEVTFAELTDTEIDDYVNIYRPLDKAGAYGIQEWIGAVAVSRIEGSFYNVMGLPVHPLYNLLSSI